jgi:hypothetical protein
VEVNPLGRVFSAKAPAFVGLSMLLALATMVIASVDSMGQAGAKPKFQPPQPTNLDQFGAKGVINDTATDPLPLEDTYNKRKGGMIGSKKYAMWPMR